jgi:hypothetical protein
VRDQGRAGRFRGATAVMASKTSSRNRVRARRFALRLPVYFRELDSSTWLEGTTENVSYTGMLFLSSSPFALESTLDLRLRLDVGAKARIPAEVVCKGVVVRQEQRGAHEALAVTIRDFRIVRQGSYEGNPEGNA